MSGAPPLTPVTLQSATDLINYPYLTKDSNRIADWNAAKDFGRNDRFYQFAARVDYEATSNLRLVGISSYSNLRVASPVDADATPFSVLFVDQRGSIKSFSQELRLEGSVARLDWMVGGNYQKDQTREIQYTTIDGSNSQAPTPSGTFIHFDGINLTNNEDIRDRAGFAGLTYKLTSHFQGIFLPVGA